MRFDASQQMRMGQHMRLAPRMIQSMEILQMPLLQLEERVEQELESNVTLEVGEVQPEGAEAAAAAEEKQEQARQETEDERPLRVDGTDGTADFERLDSFEETNPEVREDQFADATERPAPPSRQLEEPFQRARLDGERDAKSEAMANTASRGASLVEQLRDQWALADVEESLRGPGEQIISFIEDDGYLRTPLETIIDRMPPPPPSASAGKPTVAEMERALKAVQLLLEPPGVAARDTRECLLLQTDALAEMVDGADRAQWAVVRRLVEEHLEDLAQNRLPRIVEKSGLPMEQIKQAMEKMKHLSLAPARQLVDEQPGVIVPDAIVEFDQDADRYVVYLNDTRIPNLRVNREYALLAKDKETPKPTKEFLKKNLSNAEWLIEAVEQRRKTLLRVIRVVVDAQRDYFDYGPQSLRPLPMTQVAEQLGVHVATVSRAVAEKYLQTPRGMVPLRSFFTGGTHTDTGEEVSWDAIKAALKEVVDVEDKSNPLSDDALAEELTKRGVKIARRTVAKYREQLNIPAARLRKTF